MMILNEDQYELLMSLLQLIIVDMDVKLDLAELDEIDADGIIVDTLNTQRDRGILYAFTGLLENTPMCKPTLLRRFINKFEGKPNSITRCMNVDKLSDHGRALIRLYLNSARFYTGLLPFERRVMLRQIIEMI